MGELERSPRVHRLDDVRVVGAEEEDPGALRRLLVAVGGLYDRAVDAVLATPHRVLDQRHALSLLEGHGREGEALGEQITKVALIATPILRKMEVARRFTKVPGVKRLPFVMSVTTAASVGASLARGVRDVQVIGSYVASRLEEVSGRAPDPQLVKRLTVQLYLAPGTAPRVDQRIGPARLLRRWLVRGALGRDSKRQAEKAIAAVARLDVDRTLASWHALGGR